MIRVVVFLVLVGLVALGAGWLADRPGEVVITWFGYHIETSVMVLAAAAAALAVIAVLLWSLLRAIVNSPYLLARFMRDRRGARGYQAISHGLIAVGAGDVRLAKKFSGEARRIASGEPLTLLLAAQTAQLSGDRTAAETAFRTMASRPDTKLLGLHGLFIEARRRGDARTACACAEEAAAQGQTPGWAGQAVLELRCATGDWVGALDMLERNHRGGLIDKPTYRRHRAVLLTARAMAAEESDRDQAKPLALDAVKLAPTFVPAAALAGRLLAEAGEYRKASRILERAWREHPHPEIADSYAHLRSGDSARERLARAQTLAQKAPGNLESALAVARAAIDAQEFSTARTALVPHLAAPTQRVALIMAELEDAEHGDEGRAREWMARAVHAQRDPAWTADGIISDHWLPVSPVSGRLDAFEWKVPLAELAPLHPHAPATEPEALIAPPEHAAGAAIVDAGESEPHQDDNDRTTAESTPGTADEIPLAMASVAEPSPSTAAEPDMKEAAAAAPSETSAAVSPQNADSGTREKAVTGRTRSSTAADQDRPTAPIETINPLVRAPDDPGPEPPSEPAADRRNLSM